MVTIDFRDTQAITFSDENSEIFKALVRAKKIIKQPLKDSMNPHFKKPYASLDSFLKVIDEACLEVGITHSQVPTTNHEGKVGVGTLLIHESGQYIFYPPLLSGMTSLKDQQLGSSVTYMRRYSLSSIFGLTGIEDDDAEMSEEKNSGKSERKSESKNDVMNRVIKETFDWLVSERGYTRDGVIALLNTELENAGVKDKKSLVAKFTAMKNIRRRMENGNE